MGISIYTSTSPFSLEGEGWDEGDINGCFYSPRQLLPALLYLLHPCSRHPNPLQQERELGCFVTLCICNEKSCVDTYAPWVGAPLPFMMRFIPIKNWGTVVFNIAFCPPCNSCSPRMSHRSSLLTLGFVPRSFAKLNA